MNKILYGQISEKNLQGKQTANFSMTYIPTVHAHMHIRTYPNLRKGLPRRITCDSEFRPQGTVNYGEVSVKTLGQLPGPFPPSGRGERPPRLPKRISSPLWPGWVSPAAAAE
ncbi:hypothetical protein CB1_000812016 [Camelus ferus]|nr:hypothetical protein CB1_000812016 [Camelus ferus]